MFEGRKKPSELTERDRALVRKREELARVREYLRDSGLSQGVARQLRRQEANLEREIEELQRLR